MTAVVHFSAPCPCGNPDAVWRCWRETAGDEAGVDYLGTEHPAYLVECSRCQTTGTARPAVGSRQVPGAEG